MLLKSALAATALLSATAASAVTVSWASLTGAGPATVTGNITHGAANVGVSYAGNYSFAQLNNTGTYYYTTNGTPAPYTSGSVSNAPGTTDLIGLSNAGTHTINFNRTVTDVYFALVSWNGNTVVTGSPFTTVSSGCGYWGCGTFTNVTSNSFDTVNELHGVMRFQGATNSITFTTANNEFWHGFTVGIAAIPEPGQWALMIGGFGLVGGALRRRRGALVAA